MLLHIENSKHYRLKVIILLNALSMNVNMSTPRTTTKIRRNARLLRFVVRICRHNEQVETVVKIITLVL